MNKLQKLTYENKFFEWLYLYIFIPIDVWRYKIYIAFFESSKARIERENRTWKKIKEALDMKE